MNKGKDEITMQKITLMLDSIDRVKSFVELVSRYPFEIDLISGRYTVNAKSIMGIFSLDLSKAITMEIHSDDCQNFLNEIKPFIVK